MTNATAANNGGPLAGVRVLDLGTMVAGPVAATLMADFGADVIKVEEPRRGDTLRHVGPFCEGESLYWNVEGRNKRSIGLDLRRPEGQATLCDLVRHCDVLIENFRPGTMQKWNIGWPRLSQVNPALVMLSISGYGQTGPYATRAGYDRIGLAFGGLLGISGFPDRAPVRPGTAIADYQSGIIGTLGVMMALYHRDARGGRGQHVDTSLYESVFRFTDVMVTAYDKLGLVRQRMGNVHFAAAPGDHFETSDGRHLVITISNDAMFSRLCAAMERPDLPHDQRFGTHSLRAQNIDAINHIVGTWIKSKPVEQICAALDERGVACQLVLGIADIVHDPQYQARGTIVDVPHPQLGSLKMAAPTPALSETPAPPVQPAPALGQHTDDVLRDLLGYDDERINRLRNDGVI